ncbi:protein of unknown function (DUF4205), putative [Trypanosoma equiperdum]|uniref:Probable ubiquitin carboxyl-terminal hydrolase MINDY-4 n=1 Tax=Trypanosoma equiperdum TaxID=5694 RepID=A0A1G4I565_TRYEQ|nr:Domain of unknown function (DUF4205), putative [Trypanosoma equiperdum]
MPAKKATDAPVYNLPHERQVELLSEALLREYMHKRKFTDTLRTFDEENPRGPDTISSRALMSDLMTLKSETQKDMKADGIETIMEMLCCLRVQRRLEVEDLKRRAAAEVPPTPEKLKKKKSKSHDGGKGSKRKKEKKRVFAKEFEEDSPSDKDSVSKYGEKHTKRRSSEGRSDNSSSDEGSSGDESTSEQSSTSVGKGGGPKSQIGKKTARALLEVLCGAAGALPVSFLGQGFAFDGDVDYGLIQRKKGPDGVVSVVQAFVCAFFFKGPFMDVRRHQKQCLIRSIMTVLSSVQSQARLICLVDGPISADSVETDLASINTRRDFATMQDVENALHDFIDSWMQPNGSGVFCFLLSALLSHGVKAVTSALASNTTSSAVAAEQHLITADGRCSVVLTELLMPKESASTAGDDDFVLGNLALGMGAAGATCGFVTRNPDGNVTMTNGNPRCPVWIVHHEGRYVVLFLKRDNRRQLEQRRTTGATMSTDVFFYEPSVSDRGDTFVTITVNSEDENSSSDNFFLGRAIRSIPLWPSCAIHWNGAEPPF